MRLVLFCHSLLSDWGNDQTPVLRGLAMELLLRGHEVVAYEPRDVGGLERLLAEHGHAPMARFHAAYPGLASRRYTLEALDVDQALRGAHLVIVQAGAAPALVAWLGEHRARGGRYRLLFHDTSRPGATPNQALPGYDGILAGTNDLRRRYEALGWDRRILTWYAAADTRIFRPMAGSPPAAGDVVWFCDWGGDHSQRQLEEFLIEPVRRLGLRGAVFGCGFSSAAQALLASAGIECAGWVPTFDLPAIYARYPIALHLPGQPEAEAGTPASSLFQVLACSLPLVCAAWDDVDRLFRPDRDFALARDAAEMSTWLRALLSDANLAHQMARRGHRTVMARHTCARRVDQLLRFAANLHQQLRRRLPAARAPRLRQPAMLH